MKVITLPALLLCLLTCLPATAEPWFAVKTGMKCANCHENPNGGGLRTVYGNTWAQTQLPAEHLDSSQGLWTGMLNNYAAIGGNLRASAIDDDVPEQASQLNFNHDETRLYLQFSPVPGRLSLHVDQRLGPGGSTNQEAYGRYRFENQDWYVMAGQMYLPYGLRLEDDSAFIRQTPGINMTTPDQGVTLGWEPSRWSVTAAVSQGGTADRGKQVSLRGEHVRPGWRLGASINHNEIDAGNRQMQNLFAGLKTGRIYWLFEVDFVRDQGVGADTLNQRIGLLEANWNLLQGHNLKLTVEHMDPDTSIQDNEQQRYSLVWEYMPIQFMQLRLGTRLGEGPDTLPLTNRTISFLQFHGFF